MDFDLDDPLDDILKSDESDSFFDGGVKKDPGGAKSAANTAKKEPPGKAKISDLFGISKPEPTLPTQPAKKPDPPPTVEVPKPRAEPQFVARKETPKKTPELKSKVSFDDDTDLDLGFDPKAPKAKTNIFDDLLGTTQPAAKSQGLAPKVEPRPKTTPAPISRQSTFDDMPPTVQPSQGGRPRTAARSTSAIPDPLGLFSDTREKDSGKQEVAPSSKSAPVDWLGLGTDAKEVPKPIEQKASVVDRAPPQPVVQHEEIPDTAKQILSSETALQTMRQQETQLVVASQLKNQERALVDIQARQADLLRRQEVQFSELMQKQMQRQSVLEENIKRQQEKINSHLEALINQPILPGISPRIPLDAGTEDAKTETIEVVELKADVRRLELEKLRLEDLLSNVKSNHEEELILMERSHKKQISVLEETLQSLENRLKSENTSLEEFYMRKLSKLDEEKTTLVKEAEERLEELKVHQKEALETMRIGYETDIQHLREDHKRIIENIRESKLMEFSVMQENSSYIQQLKTASSFLESASGNIENLKETLNERISGIEADKARELEAKERQMAEEMRRIERSRDLAEAERLRLVDLVATLDDKITKLSQEASEEQWMLKEKLTTLEVERRSFERERDLVREEQKRHEKRIEDMKMLAQQEHQRLMEQIEDERRKLTEERLKLEMLEKINPGRTTKAEVEIALKVAEDAAREVDKERENLMKLQRECETVRRQLQDRENALKRKEVDVETAIRTAQAREAAAEGALESAKATEVQLFQKYQQLSQNTKDLCQREEKLSQSWEKLSKERLELQAMRRNLTESKCSLCRFGQTNQKIADLLSRSPISGDKAPVESHRVAEVRSLTEEIEKLPSITDDDLLIASKMKKSLKRN
ncbi:cingulin-like protein 1 [Lutzomyia longipalpis]|uniref:cingulin-like protein 1 n=1 Tax=Lutzomyia longipalpis TaxID=7200 RepID=UPI002483BAB9|nr:cingulin-like protein 1 [Lutzomyia longipalpis]